MRWFVLLALTGCLVVPKTETTTRNLGTYTTPTIAGKVGRVQLAVTGSYGEVHVRAVHMRHCLREVHAKMEQRTEQTAKVVGGDPGNDPRALVVAAVISAPLMVVSGLITAGVLAGDHPHVERWDETINVIETPCPEIAVSVAVELALPSGATLEGTTDAFGNVAFAIPASEPAQGTILVRAEDAAVATTYSRDPRLPAFAPPAAAPVRQASPAPVVESDEPPATPSESELRAVAQQHGFAGVRDALRACGRAQDVHGVVSAQLVIEGDGSVHANPDRGGVAFNTCVNGALGAVRFPAGHQQHLVFPYQL